MMVSSNNVSSRPEVDVFRMQRITARKRMMKNYRFMRAFTAMVFGVLSLSSQAAARATTDQMCPSLRAFVASINKGEARTLEFHTSWGRDFKDSTSTAYVFAATRCEFYGYAPAEAACGYLMKHGAVEFSGRNAISAITCLSPGSRFAPSIDLGRVDVSFFYGSEKRGGKRVTVLFDEDSKLGGMVMSIKVNGF
jgi:hypothetical protein